MLSKEDIEIANKPYKQSKKSKQKAKNSIFQLSYISNYNALSERWCEETHATHVIFKSEQY